MKADGHLDRAMELMASMDKLDEGGTDVAAIVELAHGMVHHFCAYRLLRDHDVHHDKHQAIQGDLQRFGHLDQADAFRELEILRAGRWYGGKGNGEATKRVMHIAKEFMQWATSK